MLSPGRLGEPYAIRKIVIKTDTAIRTEHVQNSVLVLPELNQTAVLSNPALACSALNRIFVNRRHKQSYTPVVSLYLLTCMPPCNTLISCLLEVGGTVPSLGYIVQFAVPEATVEL